MKHFQPKLKIKETYKGMYEHPYSLHKANILSLSREHFEEQKKSKRFQKKIGNENKYFFMKTELRKGKKTGHIGVDAIPELNIEIVSLSEAQVEEALQEKELFENERNNKV